MKGMICTSLAVPKRENRRGHAQFFLEVKMQRLISADATYMELSSLLIWQSTYRQLKLELELRLHTLQIELVSKTELEKLEGCLIYQGKQNQKETKVLSICFESEILS